MNLYRLKVVFNLKVLKSTKEVTRIKKCINNIQNTMVINETTSAYGSNSINLMNTDISY